MNSQRTRFKSQVKHSLTLKICSAIGMERKHTKNYLTRTNGGDNMPPRTNQQEDNQSWQPPKSFATACVNWRRS
ncbi:hypothetical protein SUPREME284_59 [Citrobacter phage vB_CfrD_Supreme284]|nr:hypothetical protein SUPREME284_59 [Citrobacter phage vB_CfrD_Supreme284]